MKVTFKGSTDSFVCTEPVEQKMFRAGTAVGWALMFHLHGALSSSEIDKLITPESISELVFTSEETEQMVSFKLAGYSVVTSCVVRHKAGLTVTELQLTKATESEEAEDSGTV